MTSLSRLHHRVLTAYWLFSHEHTLPNYFSLKEIFLHTLLSWNCALVHNRENVRDHRGLLWLCFEIFENLPRIIHLLVVSLPPPFFITSGHNRPLFVFFSPPQFPQSHHKSDFYCRDTLAEFPSIPTASSDF